MQREAFWATKAREWDNYKAVLISCGDVERPYLTPTNINRLLAGIRGIVFVAEWVQRAYTFTPKSGGVLWERTVAVIEQWKGFEEEVLNVVERYQDYWMTKA